MIPQVKHFEGLGDALLHHRELPNVLGLCDVRRTQAWRCYLSKGLVSALRLYVCSLIY